MIDDRLKEYLRSFTVLVQADDPSAVSVIPGAQNDVLVELRLKKYGMLQDQGPPGLVGDVLKLHFDRDKARELAQQILRFLDKTT